MNKKSIMIVIISVVAVVLVVGGLGILFFKENKTGDKTSVVTNTDEGDNLDDGQIFDYE